MGKLRAGPPSSVINCSNGAENSKLNFYSSSYSTYHGKEGFVPRAAKPTGTGYLANFRPGVAYSETIDRLDNVAVGKILAEGNYTTSYEDKHKPYYNGSNGKDKLPIQIKRNESGFTHKPPITTADSKSVNQARLNTLDEGVHRALLHRLHNKRVPHLDQGALNLVTETDVCYKGKPSDRMSTHLKDVGTMEPSGFTHYHHFDPVQYLDKSPYNGHTSYHRPTGVRHNEAVYVCWPNLKGWENNSGVCKRAQRDNGYSYDTARPRYVQRVPDKSFTRLEQVPRPVARRIKKQDPCEFVNLTEGANTSTLATKWFKGEQSQQSETYDCSKVGRKESTGFSQNNDRYVKVNDDQKRFRTHYDVKYGESLYKGKYRGWANASNFRKPTNGFTKSTIVHIYGDGKNFRERQYESCNPLVAKLIKKENPCYVDNTRSLKLRNSE